jgi:hypothetical protein
MVEHVAPEEIEPEPGVDHALNQQDLPARQITYDVTGQTDPAAVGGKGTEGHEVDLKVPVNAADQVRHERQTPLEDANCNRSVLQNPAQFLAQFGDPRGNLI